MRLIVALMCVSALGAVLSGCGNAQPGVSSPPTTRASRVDNSCDVSHLRLTLVPERGGLGNGDDDAWYELYNEGASLCTLDGFARISVAPLQSPVTNADIGPKPQVVRIPPGGYASFFANGQPQFTTPFDDPQTGTKETVTIWLPGASQGIAYQTRLITSFPPSMTIGAVTSGPPEAPPGTEAALQPWLGGAVALNTRVVS